MRRYPLCVGALFGVLQTGYFLQLSFAFSSAAITLFSVTLAWLVGSLGGLLIAQRLKVRGWPMSVLCIGSYLLCSALLLRFPLQNELLPLYITLLAFSGLYAGWFFGTMGRRYAGRIDRLFFWENNGFVLGLIIATLAYLFLGRVLLQALPLFLGMLAFPPTLAEKHPNREIELSNLFKEPH